MPGVSTCEGTDGAGLGETDALGDAAGVVAGGTDGERAADGPLEPVATEPEAAGPDGTGPVGAVCSPGEVVPQAAISATDESSTVSA
jgi:hypothetical protein